MPELPEVESVRRSLRGLLGRRVRRVWAHRPQVIVGPWSPAALLVDQTIRRLERRGKQLFIAGSSGAWLGVHLGMTGSLRHKPGGAGAEADGLTRPAAARRLHAHLVWQLDDGSLLVFRDPRRFGVIRTWPDAAGMRAFRASLGPDALAVDAACLGPRLRRTRRALKAALLDQRLLAGLGNIYVDELLFACGLRPTRCAARLTGDQVRLLARRLGPLLRAAIAAKGSTISTHADARGRSGAYQLRHQVYGRSGQMCLVCKGALRTGQVGGRTTVFCPHCQK